MSLDSLETHGAYISMWKLLHADAWKKFANNENNDKLLREGAERFRPCPKTAVDQEVFTTTKNAFTRTDGRTEADDQREATARAAATEAEQERNTTVDVGFIEYAMSLAPSQVAQAYYADPSSGFSRKPLPFARSRAWIQTVPLEISPQPEGEDHNYDHSKGLSSTSLH